MHSNPWNQDILPDDLMEGHLRLQLLEADETKDDSRILKIAKEAINAHLDGFPTQQESARLCVLNLHSGLVDLALEIAETMSPFEWCWYLRRTPLELVAGSVKSTANYVRLIAESMASRSTRLSPRFHPVEDQFFLPVTKAAVDSMRRLLYLSGFIHACHSALRRIGKGAMLDIDEFGIPLLTKVDPTTRDAINLFDERNVQSGDFLSTLGIADPPGRVTYLLDRQDQGIPVWLPSHSGIRNANYVSIRIPYEHIRELIEENSPTGATQIDCELQSLIILLQIQNQLGSHQGNAINTLYRGYSLTSRQHYRKLIALSIKQLRTQGVPISLRPADAESEMRKMGASILPVVPGNLVRTSGQFTIVDACGASVRFRNRLTYSNVTGHIGNARGSFFEKTLQALIDGTAWMPRGATRDLIGKKISDRSGGAITDIDCVAARGKTLILIDCKSKVRSEDYEVGAFQSVRSIRTALEGDAVMWDSKMKRVINEVNPPVMGSFRNIIPLVCTTFVPYVASPHAIEELLPGLRRIVSASELSNWLRKAP